MEKIKDILFIIVGILLALPLLKVDLGMFPAWAVAVAFLIIGILGFIKKPQPAL